MSRNTLVTTVTEVQSGKIQLNQTELKPNSTVPETILFVWVGLAAIGTIATFLTRELRKKKEEREIRGNLTKIPCPNCQYFSKSSYLRCAVQPKLTMTNEAIHCSDFNPPTD